MATELQCGRCQRSAKGLDSAPPLPNDLAAEVLAKICGDCWRQWTEEEVKFINEHRLNFMDPEAADILHRHLRKFLALTSPADG